MSAVIKAENNQIATQAPTPATLLQMAVEQGADLDRLERLMDLQAKWEESEARKAFTIAMTAFRSECPAIDKNAKGHNSKYATLAHTIELIKAPMSDHGLSHRWETNQQPNGLITVTCFVTHSLGCKESTTLTAGCDSSGSKNAIQAIGSTISYLQRYTLFAILGLASGEQDDDGHTSGPSSNTISGKPLDKDRVLKATNYFIHEINMDEDEETVAPRIKEAYKRLTQDEAIAVNNNLKSHKFENRQLNTILAGFLKFEPTLEEI